MTTREMTFVINVEGVSAKSDATLAVLSMQTTPFLLPMPTATPT